MKIYTKTGDTGETGLFAGPRVRKNHPRIDSYGTVDELNAVLGLIRCETLAPGLNLLLDRIQNELFDLGAELATPDPERHGLRILGAHQIAALEAAIDMYEGHLEPLRVFILPGGTRVAALLHLARTVCRRAEREVVGLSTAEPVASELVIYLNRLSDLLFVLARWANQQANLPDVPWTSGKK